MELKYKFVKNRINLKDIKYRISMLRKNRKFTLNVERVYGQDKQPINKIKATALSLLDYIEALRNEIMLDITSMNHLV